MKDGACSEDRVKNTVCEKFGIKNKYMGKPVRQALCNSSHINSKLCPKSKNKRVKRLYKENPAYYQQPRKGPKFPMKQRAL